jgi:hypothetical protein
MKKTTKTTTAPTSFSIFINPRIEKQLENGPLIRATGQVCVYQTEDYPPTENGWRADSDIMDIDEIILMGVSIKTNEEKKKTIDHFKSMGINLYQIVDKELDEIVAGSGDVKQFVFEQIGIKLP